MTYDAIVIGTGQAGPSLAAGFAYKGEKVALIEGAQLGGSCVNYGCTPTKSLRASARVLHMARRGGEYGLDIPNITVDFARVMGRKADIVDESRDGLTGWLESIEGLDIIYGWASLDGKDGDLFRVVVNEQVLTAPRIYLNTGTRAFIPPIEGIADISYMTNVDFMQMTELPEELLILGGGYIGLELGQIMNRFGSKVTIIEYAPRVAVREDDDVIDAVEELLTGEGITLKTGVRATKAEQDENGIITLTLQDSEGNLSTVTGTNLLIATGRQLNTDNLNLESIGLELGERGVVETNGRLETSVEGVWAVGDINGRGAFTHTSYQDHEIVMANYEGNDRSADDRITTYAVFLDPPLGRVGLSEKQARESGKNVLMATWQMSGVSRAKEQGETHGLIKFLVDADTEQIIGGTVFGFQGDDIVQVISNFMATGASYTIMRDTLPVHPTITEFFPTILKSLSPLE